VTRVVLLLALLAGCRHAPVALCLTPLCRDEVEIRRANLALVKCRASVLERRCWKQQDRLALALDRYREDSK